MATAITHNLSARQCATTCLGHAIVSAKSIAAIAAYSSANAIPLRSAAKEIRHAIESIAIGLNFDPRKGASLESLKWHLDEEIMKGNLPPSIVSWIQTYPKKIADLEPGENEIIIVSVEEQDGKGNSVNLKDGKPQSHAMVILGLNSTIEQSIVFDPNNHFMLYTPEVKLSSTPFWFGRVYLRREGSYELVQRALHIKIQSPDNLSDEVRERYSR